MFSDVKFLYNSYNLYSLKLLSICKKSDCFFRRRCNKIQLADSSLEVVIPLENIKNVRLHISGARMAKLGIRSFIFEDYFYFEIKTNNNKKIIINSLYNNNLDDVFKKNIPL